MSIVTFWNDDREQSGKTLTTVAVGTKMAIERNFKILILSTAYQDPTMKNCFWTDTIQKKLKKFGGRNNNIAVENGIEGLSKLIKANKIQPSIITDYTKVIFKERLEVLSGYKGAEDNSEEEKLLDYIRTSECYPELIRLANQYYDMVLVDVDNQLEPKIKKQILDMADLNILVITQRLASLNKYNELKENHKELINLKNMRVIGKYDRNSKYNRKNILRYLDEKKDISIIPYNTLYFESAEEANVTELFLKLRDIKDTTDENYFFMSEVLALVDKIVKRLQELQLKKR